MVGEEQGRMPRLLALHITSTNSAATVAWCVHTGSVLSPCCNHGVLQDGFIHLTKEADLLLGVANHFYKQVPGDFLVLAIDSKQLSSKVGGAVP